jgi:hypothetical protein
MLLDVMIPAKADGPSIRWLQARASVSVPSHMSAFDRSGQAVGDAAMMFAHPGTMSRALTAIRFTRPLALKPVR